LNTLDALLHENYATVEAMIDDGLDPNEVYEIEHHIVSGNFDKLEKAAVDLVRAGYHVDDAEEFEGEDGSILYYFAAVTEAKLDADVLAEQTKAVFELATQAGVEYDGWGTWLGDEEDDEFDDEAE